MLIDGTVPHAGGQRRGPGELVPRSTGMLGGDRPGRGWRSMLWAPDAREQPCLEIGATIGARLTDPREERALEQLARHAPTDQPAPVE